MFKRSKVQYRFKTYKSDAAPFFFFIDIFPLDLKLFDTPYSIALAKQIKNNPIMPLPMRIDRVFNGESSIVIRPTSPVSFPLNETATAVINPIPFLRSGIENLLFFTEIRSQERLYRSLKQEKVSRWWENTRFLYGNLHQIEEDFSAFLKAYLYTIIKAKINEEDMIGAAIEYCEIINNICKERMLRNKILVEIKSKQESVKLYREKESKHREKLKVVTQTQYHPELIDIEVHDFSDNGFPNRENFKDTIANNTESFVTKYIPLLLYDDLQECMLLNLKQLEVNEPGLLDPSFLLENNVILLLKTEEIEAANLTNYSWLSDLTGVDLGIILNSLSQNLNLKIE
ncbi:MAG: hypothetical protein ACFE9R_04485 [Candidatus Hermodarchaeota archaeon]